MKTLFVTSAAISGVISFCAVRAYQVHEQKQFDAKMKAVDDWFDRKK